MRNILPYSRSGSEEVTPVICVVPHCGYLSETSRMLEIHRALRVRGAPVRLATHGGTHESLLGQEGVDYDRLEPGLTSARCTELVQSGPGLGPPDQSMWTDDEMLAHAQGEASFFRDHDVAVVVTGFALTTLLSSRLAGVHLVTEHAGSFVPAVAERGLLPLPTSPTLPPPLRDLPPDVARRAYNEQFGSRELYTAGFNRVAARLGVEPVPGLPAMLLGDLTLVTDLPEVVGVSAEEMEGWRPAPGSPYRPATRLAYAGPIHAHLDVPVPPRAEALLRRPGPTVYVAMTSTPPDLVRAVVADVVAAGDWTVLVAGTVHDLADLESLAPSRVVVEGVLPSHLVLPRVAAAVVTGGQGSVHAALSSGTPFVGVPLHAEQDLNTHLAAQLGAAVIRPAGSVEGHVGADVVRLLADPSYGAAADRWAARFAAVDGPGLAAERILALHTDIESRTPEKVVR
jgi:UDP:flavonoid glycosyltransferase YjiC (YdhE family)